MPGSHPRARRALEVIWATAGLALVAGVAIGVNPIPSTLNDFYQPGTQPGVLTDSMMSAMNNCRFCHGEYNEAHAPFDRWAASMMGQAARDPIFHACLDIALQDSPAAGEMCLRCHTPQGWLAGRSSPPDGSALAGADLEGVACSVCHRMVDPQQDPMLTNPPEDGAILQALAASGDLPSAPHSGTYVIDPEDRRRGPFNLNADWNHQGGFFYHDFLQSPFHQSSQLCATCHDVSNPLYERQGDGSYALSAYDTPHGTGNKYEQFPVERTYSEWASSAFAQGPIEMGGRFGGNKTAVSSCQDCHMPDTSGEGCALNPPLRHNLPQHNFNGANSWVLAAINASNLQGQTGLTDENVEASLERNRRMLEAASDLALYSDGSTLTARIINYSGHKLPTGYGEGRRMWIHVVFQDALGQAVAEYGAYDPETAVLDATGTRVYEVEQGVDAAVAAAADLPVGPSFHFALNNKVYKDNRIPPIGFTNAAFEQVQAEPVAHVYADGQHWDDAAFAIPPGAATALVTVYHQTTTKEYIEFLRDENVNSVGDPLNPSTGEIAYNLWVAFGKSKPVEMDNASINLACPCDLDVNGADVFDLLAYLDGWFEAAPAADYDLSGSVDVFDLLAYLDCWFACPV